MEGGEKEKERVNKPVGATTVARREKGWPCALRTARLKTTLYRDCLALDQPSLRHFQHLRQLAFSYHDSLQSSTLVPIPEQSSCCQTVVSCEKRVPSPPVSFDFSVLFLHSISLIHRHLAVYHSQVAISEFGSFELSPTSKIRPDIRTLILSPL